MTFHVDLSGIEMLDKLSPLAPTMMLEFIYVDRAWTTGGPIWSLALNFRPLCRSFTAPCRPR